MKAFRILGRNIRDAFKSVSRNFSLSIASITCTTITLVLVAIAIVVSYNVNNFTKDLENELTIIVFVDKSITREEKELLDQKLDSFSNIEEIDYFTNEEIKEDTMQKDKDLAIIMETWTPETNPLDHQYQIKVKEVEKLSKTAEEINELDKINNVKYGKDIVDNLIPVFGFVQKATIIIVIALILVTAFLISNTIKLTIHSRRNEIEIMRLVGTRNLVIRLPFLFEGLVLGIIGSILPILIAIYGYFLLYEKSGGVLVSKIIKLASPTPFILYVSAILLAVGALVGMFGSYRAVRKYLKI